MRRHATIVLTLLCSGAVSAFGQGNCPCGAGREEPVTVRTYRLQHASPAVVSRFDGPGLRLSVYNNWVVISGPEATVTAIEAALRKVDAETVAAGDVLFTITLVSGSREGENAGPAAKDGTIDPAIARALEPVRQEHGLVLTQVRDPLILRAGQDEGWNNGASYLSQSAVTAVPLAPGMPPASLTSSIGGLLVTGEKADRRIRARTFTVTIRGKPADEDLRTSLDLADGRATLVGSMGLTPDHPVFVVVTAKVVE